MVLGMSLPAFTLVHVAISFVAIAAGIVAVWQMYSARLPRGWTAVFLSMTALTCITGYFFPADKVLPSHVVGAITLGTVVLATLALYRYRLERSWRWIYVVSAIAALYLNVFVGVVQSFLKIPALNALAPTQAEAPFAIAQAAVLLFFVGVTIVVLRMFRPQALTPANPA